MNQIDIAKNAPHGATHYMTYGDNVLYMMKMTFWYRHVYQNGFKDWHYCKPSLFIRLFRIKRIKKISDQEYLGYGDY